VFDGKVLANIWVFDLGYTTTIKGLYFAQDMKLAYFLLQCEDSYFPANLSFDGVVTDALTDPQDPAAETLPCPMCGHDFRDSFFPWRSQLGPESYYWDLHECSRERIQLPILQDPLQHLTLLVGRDRSTSLLLESDRLSHTSLLLHHWCRSAHSRLLPQSPVPQFTMEASSYSLFLEGLNYLPPATGMNYGSWAVVGLTFGWLIRK